MPGPALPPPDEAPRPWTHRYPPGVPTTYRYPSVALTRLLDDAARDFPDVDAVRSDGATLTYAQLAGLVDRTAAALVRLGVRRGTRVATLLPNTAAAVIVPFAAWRLGAVVVPLDVRDDAVLLRGQAAQTRVEVVVCDPSLADTFTRDRALTPAVRHVITAARDAWGEPSTSARVRAVAEQAVRRLRPSPPELWLPEAPVPDLVELAAETSGVPAGSAAGSAAIPAHAPALVAFSAGTTGPRRPVVLSHANLVANAIQARLWVPDIQAGRDVVLGVLPFCHLYGFTVGMLQTVLSAGTLVLLDDPRDGHAVLAAVERHRVTLLPSSPHTFADIVAFPEVDRYDLTSLRACLTGGAALSPQVAARFEVLTGGARLRAGYGLTEASPLTHANPIYGRYRNDTIGFPVTDTAAVIVDPARPSRLVPAGNVGELLVAGPQVSGTGWLATGDLAVMDDEGWFTLHGRVRGVPTAVRAPEDVSHRDDDR